VCFFYTIMKHNHKAATKLFYFKRLGKKNYAGTVGMNLLECESHYKHIMLAL